MQCIMNDLGQHLRFRRIRGQLQVVFHLSGQLARGDPAIYELRFGE